MKLVAYEPIMVINNIPMLDTYEPMLETYEPILVINNMPMLETYEPVPVLVINNIQYCQEITYQKPRPRRVYFASTLRTRRGHLASVLRLVCVRPAGTLGPLCGHRAGTSRPLCVCGQTDTVG